MQGRWRVGALGVAVAAGALACAAVAATPASEDPIAQLQARLDKGEAHVEWREDGGGYLKSLLDNLGIAVDSQVLVFSKTSLQVDKIAPKTPRAIYFNDDVAIGSVHDGRLIEVIAVDPKEGLTFWSFPTQRTANPRFEQHGEECTACHGRVNRWAQAMIVANVIPQDDGTPLVTRTDRLFDVTDHRTPYDQRWGGWYITGSHGAMRHNGNVFADPASPGELDPKAGLNLTDLKSRIDVARYLAPTSDIVAIMTLEHQVGATNLIGQINAQLKSVGDARLTAAQRATPGDIDASIGELADYLLMIDEPPLPSPVKGVSGFAARFASEGPHDAQGRSLRTLDLQTRLLRYPLSFMIYSRAFESLDPQAREKVYRRLFEVLSGQAASGKFARLSAADRRAALEIAAATKADLPAYWRAAVR